MLCFLQNPLFVDWGSWSCSFLTELLSMQLVEVFETFYLIKTIINSSLIFFSTFKQSIERLQETLNQSCSQCFPLHLHLLALLALQLKPCSSMQLSDRCLLLSLSRLKFQIVLHYFLFLEEFKVHHLNRPLTNVLDFSEKVSCFRLFVWAVTGCGLKELSLYSCHRSVCEESYLGWRHYDPWGASIFIGQEPFLCWASPTAERY